MTDLRSPLLVSFGVVGSYNQIAPSSSFNGEAPMGFSSRSDKPLPLLRACLLLAAWEAVEQATEVKGSRLESIHSHKQ